jgi:hypothetical protein
VKQTHAVGIWVKLMVWKGNSQTLLKEISAIYAAALCPQN